MPGKNSRLIWCLFGGFQYFLIDIGLNQLNLCFHLCTCHRTSELEETEFFSFHSGVKRGDIVGICGYPGSLACLALNYKFFTSNSYLRKSYAKSGLLSLMDSLRTAQSGFSKIL